MKASKINTDFMCVNESKTGVTVKLQRIEIVRADKFKSLRPTIQSHKKCTRDEEVSVEWVEMNGRVMCDRSSKSEREGLRKGRETCYDV